MGMFQDFRHIIAGASERDVERDVTLGGRLTLARHDRLEISYAPFEHIIETARVVIVGITPGREQAANALKEARRQVLAGADDRDTLAAAKSHASFSGQMRDRLVAMLDHIGLNSRLGIPTCATLWDGRPDLAHFTSALRYPVFLDGKNYNGTPPMVRTPLLRGLLSDCLADEARMLPQAIWIPCGSTAAKGVEWLVAQRILDREHVLLGLPHPSPANVERVQYFLGTGRPRHMLSNKTDPNRIDSARMALISRLRELR